MLLPKSVAPNDICSIRLASGEEVIGRLIDRNEQTITLAKPRTLQVQMVQPGQFGLALVPPMISLDENGSIAFSAAHVAAGPLPVRADIAAEYTTRTSGLAVPGMGQMGSLLTKG